VTTPLESSSKPVPEVDAESRPFFSAALHEQLALPRCSDCRSFLGLTSNVCTECLSENVEWAVVSGRGTLFSFGIMHQKYHPGFANDIPYNIAIVELEEGPRLQTNIVGIDNGELHVGLPVVVTFERVSDDVALPKFRPAPG
jgi:uncharacterized OB-fold protein